MRGSFFLWGDNCEGLISLENAKNSPIQIDANPYSMLKSSKMSPFLRFDLPGAVDIDSRMGPQGGGSRRFQDCHIESAQRFRLRVHARVTMFAVSCTALPHFKSIAENTGDAIVMTPYNRYHVGVSRYRYSELIFADGFRVQTSDCKRTTGSFGNPRPAGPF